MITAMGYQRSEVYIANVVKCRPPENRDPTLEERYSCRPFLVGQIQSIQPEVIVTLGKVASQTVLETDARISRLRGRWTEYPRLGIPVMPTYPPAALLRNAHLTRPVWEDLQKVMESKKDDTPQRLLLVHAMLAVYSRFLEPHQEEGCGIVEKLWRAIGIAVAMTASTAWACGGFFCSNFPMDQVGEKIVFRMDGDEVTATIQIQFEGDAEDFSWVLPLPSVPAQDGGMEVSTEELFVQLLNRTNPSFSVNWTGGTNASPTGEWTLTMLQCRRAHRKRAGGSVEVLQVRKSVHTASVVKSDGPDALSAWLAENDYEQPPEALPLIAHYVAQDRVFLALKLQQNKGSGDIAPIR